jgi:threonine/homoserine/homoserine lactone efflux protein
MDIGVWLAFVLASGLILIMPGPTIILVVSQAMVHGKKSVIPLAAGVVGGDFTALGLSLLGVGTLLNASASLFALCKWIGALYLLYLGLRLWFSRPETMQIATGEGYRSRPSLFRNSFVVTALNPKSISFFVAFLPQFVDPGRQTFSQLLILGATFLVLAAINALLYGFFAGHLSHWLNRAGVQSWLARGGGSALIAAGVATAMVKRAA